MLCIIHFPRFKKRYRRKSNLSRSRRRRRRRRTRGVRVERRRRGQNFLFLGLGAIRQAERTLLSLSLSLSSFFLSLLQFLRSLPSKLQIRVTASHLLPPPPSPAFGAAITRGGVYLKKIYSPKWKIPTNNIALRPETRNLQSVWKRNALSKDPFLMDRRMPC